MQQSKRIVFMGSPAFSVPSLERLIQKNYNIVGVYTQPPKPVGRGYKMQATPVQDFAEKYDLPVFTPTSFKKEVSALTELKNLKPDLIITIAYGMLLPISVLNVPPFKCLNLHASLLPRWRGAAPIQYALLNGDKKTGVTLMEMEEGLDSGPILYQEKISITEKSTSIELLQALSQLSADILEKTLPLYFSNKLMKEEQSAKAVTYAPKIKKIDGEINWNKPANFVVRQIKALSPWPGVYFNYKNIKIKVLDAVAISSSNQQEKLGCSLVDKELIFQCAENTAIKCTVVQKPGKKSMTCEEFLRGNPIKKGTCLV